jgi:hypothetical protein
MEMDRDMERNIDKDIDKEWDRDITNENIYFENYYDEQRKFERII